MLLHPLYSPRKLGRVAKHSQRVERVDERECYTAVVGARGVLGVAELDEGIRVAARERLQLVVWEGEPHVAVVAVVEHRSHVLSHVRLGLGVPCDAAAAEQQHAENASCP